MSGKGHVLKRLFCTASAAAVMISACAVNAVTASAAESYDPYSYDQWGDAVSSQAGYTAADFIDGQKIKGLYEHVEAMDGFDYDEEEWKNLLNMKEPADMFISGDNLLYIADKANNRILVTDLDFNLVNYLDTFYYNGKTLKLKNPEGVFVDKYTGYIYICDSEGGGELNDEGEIVNNAIGRVIKCDTRGTVDRLFEKPVTELYDQQLTYNPRKVAVDKAGNVYIVVRSVTRGAVMFDISGDFIGFYGANRVEATAEIVMNAFWNLIATQEQIDRTKKVTPVGFTNFDLDDDGFIYTVTESADVKTDVVKKLNPRGANILSSALGDDTFFGDIPPAYYSIYTKTSALTDIDIGPSGEMNILDFAHGRVFQYDKMANLMFVLGGDGDQLGTFRSVSAIESYDNKIFVLDSRKNGITVFERTAFGDIVTEATNLYNAGYYEESFGPWQTVIKFDGNYRRAYVGVGNALLSAEQYKEAMEYFKISQSRRRYNRAFEGYRDQILQKWFTPAIILIIVIVVATKVIGSLNKKGIITFPWQRKGGV